MAQAVDEDGYIWNVDAAGNAIGPSIGRVGGKSAQPGGSILRKPEDPFKAADEARKAAEAERERIKFEERNKPKPSDSKPLLTAKERADAIGAYKSAEQMLSTLIPDMERKFQAGPGATDPWSLSALSDFVSSPANQQFDKSSNAMRGQVGSLLGFTGGQLNTATEAAAAVGPYISQASDYDTTITDNASRLRDLANQARERSIAILGGIPDANGNVTPVQASAPVAATQPSVPPTPIGQQQDQSRMVAPGAAYGRRNDGDGGGDPSIVSSPDAGASAMLDGMIRQGRSAGEINARLGPLGFAPVDQGQITSWQKFLRANPTYRDPVGQANRLSAPTMAQQAVASPVGAGVIGAINGSTMGLSDEIAGAAATPFNGKSMEENIAAADAAKQGIRGLNPTSFGLGEVGGGIAASALLPGAAGARTFALRNMLGDAAYGAGYGAGEQNDDRVNGAMVGGAAGLGGGLGGRFVGNRVANAVSPTVSKLAQTLRDSGVLLTPGQIARSKGGKIGGMIADIEDVAQNSPLFGAVTGAGARRADGMAQFDKAAFDRTADITGQTVSEIGETGIDQINGVVNNAFGNAYDGLTVPFDQALTGDLRAIASRLPNMPRHADDIRAAYRGEVRPLIQGGTISGDALQEATQVLNREAAAVMPQPGGYAAAQTYKDGAKAFRDLVGRQAPDRAEAIGKANATNSHAKVLQQAVLAAKNQPDQMFTPAQLANAASSNTQKFGGKAKAASGDVPFRDLTEAGQALLPNKIPPTGVNLAPWLAAGGLGLGGYGQTENPGAGIAASAALPLLLAAPYTKTGTKLVNKALIGERSQAAKWLGDYLRQRTGLLGTAGATLALPSQ